MKLERINIRITAEDKAKLIALAKAENLTITEYIITHLLR